MKRNSPNGCKISALRFSVLSGKGGVGKSTVAVNLATALANQEKTVGLLDVDVHGPSIPALLGLNGCVLQAEDEEILPVEVSERLKSVSIGFLLHNNTDAVIWRGPKKYQVIQQFRYRCPLGETGLYGC